jgi:hypothetical protein
MYQPEPSFQSFNSLMTSIEDGQIKIPQFQRQFVWSKKNSAKLLDSIVKGYPIGTFIFWRTKESLRSIRNIGNITLPIPKDGEYVDYVLDGQQRLTSLFASFKALNIKREDNKEEDFSKMFINLKATFEEEIVTTEIVENEEQHFLKVSDLIYGGIKYLSSFPDIYLEKIDQYKTRIKGYNFPVVQIKEAPIDVATEVFTRLNVGGKALTLFEIMVAKTYDHDRGFDLAEEYDKMLEELRPIEYDTIASATVLQVVSILMKKECTRRQILKLDKQDFINIWPEAKDAIFRALEYFKNHYRIPVSQLLPYNALIVPFAYFFFKHKDKPTGVKQKYLQDFFWRCAIGVRYSSGVENKLAKDVERIDSILVDQLPRYDWAIDTSTQYIEDNGWFSAGRSFIKAILCIYAYNQPKSFIDNSIVNIGNQYLKQANSKNYHHFFPKAHLRKKEESDFYINHVLNITIVDDFLNKREIKAKAPSQYMAKFLKQNPDLEETMKTHCIRGLDKFGIWENDYEKFFYQRAKLVSRELNKRIIIQDTDQELKATKIYDDYEQTDVEN